jgi:hypothetical protein
MPNYIEKRYLGKSNVCNPLEIIIDYNTKNVYFPELEFTDPNGKITCECYGIKTMKNGEEYVYIPNFKKYRRLKSVTGKKKMFSNLEDVLSWECYPADVLNSIVDEYAHAAEMNWQDTSVMDFEPMYFLDRKVGEKYREKTIKGWDVPIEWIWTLSASIDSDVQKSNIFFCKFNDNIYACNEKEILHNEDTIIRFKSYKEAKECVGSIREKLLPKYKNADIWDIEVRQYVLLNLKEEK